MDPIADFLVQRYIPNAPNEMTGAWVDEGVATDLRAGDAQTAIQQLATQPARYRALRWDNTEEFDTTPGPPITTKATKRSRDADQPNEGVGGVPTP